MNNIWWWLNYGSKLCQQVDNWSKIKVSRVFIHMNLIECTNIDPPSIMHHFCVKCVSNIWICVESIGVNCFSLPTICFWSKCNSKSIPILDCFLILLLLVLGHSRMVLLHPIHCLWCRTQGSFFSFTQRS